MWFDLFDRLPIHRNDEMQHAMRRRMLWPDIDDKITFLGCGEFFDHGLCFPLGAEKFKIRLFRVVPLTGYNERYIVLLPTYQPHAITA